MENSILTNMLGRTNCVIERCGFVVSKYNSVNICVYNIYIRNMILDTFFSFHQKVIFSILCAGLWIFFRTSDCYSMIPRLHIFPVIFVMSWAYLNYYEPLFLPIGLGILVLYSKLKDRFTEFF